MATEAELAYIAGFIDADGCIGTQQVKGRSGKIHRYPTLSASQKTKEVLVFVQHILGGQITIRPGNPKGLSTTPTYVWRLTGKERILEALQRLLPYLIVKHEKAKHAVNQFRQESKY